MCFGHIIAYKGFWELDKRGVRLSSLGFLGTLHTSYVFTHHTSHIFGVSTGAGAKRSGSIYIYSEPEQPWGQY